MTYDTSKVLQASRYFLAQAKSACGANAEGGGGFQLGNTCGSSGANRTEAGLAKPTSQGNKAGQKFKVKKITETQNYTRHTRDGGGAPAKRTSTAWMIVFQDGTKHESPTMSEAKKFAEKAGAEYAGKYTTFHAALKEMNATPSLQVATARPKPSTAVKYARLSGGSYQSQDRRIEINQLPDGHWAWAVDEVGYDAEPTLREAKQAAERAAINK